MNVPAMKIRQKLPVEDDLGRECVSDVEEAVHLAEILSRSGEIAVMDMDAEAGTGDNLKIIKTLCARFPCRVRGGIRSAERGRALLRAGAERIVAGRDADLELLRAFRPVHLILEVDASQGDVKARFREAEHSCHGFLITALPVSAETHRVDVEEIRRLSMLTERRLCAEVDDITLEEIATLDRVGVDVQVGRALHEGRIVAAEALSACVRWAQDGTVPTVVEDAAGQVLMVALSSRESLEKSLMSGEGTYHDPERGGIRRKGERSGNDQLVLRCTPSCDRTALLFLVKQAGNACHTGSYSCFGEREFGLDFLSEVATAKRSSDPTSSYTARLLGDPDLRSAKIREKVDEIARTRRRDEAQWAIADLVYFLVVESVSRGLTWAEVIRELRGRQR